MASTTSPGPIDNIMESNFEGNSVEFLPMKYSQEFCLELVRTRATPIPCPPPSPLRSCEKQEEEMLEEMYKLATWQMYHRIVNARKKNILTNVYTNEVITGKYFDSDAANKDTDETYFHDSEDIFDMDLLS